MLEFLKIWIAVYLLLFGLLAAHRRFYLKEAFSIELPIIPTFISAGIAKVIYDVTVK
jgi:hypothetical protein